jgi:hypothetical protein
MNYFIKRASILFALILLSEVSLAQPLYFEQFRPAKKWSLGVQLGPTTLNGDADDTKLGFALGLHGKYSISQSFGLKLSGNFGHLTGGRENPNFSGNFNRGRFGAQSVTQQNPDDRQFNLGNQAPGEDSYIFRNNFRDVGLTMVYTLGNISFLRPLRKLQMYTFFGFGAIWSNVVGEFNDPNDAQAYYSEWGDAFFEPEFDANNNIVNARSYYKGTNFTIPFGIGVKRNLGRLMDLGVEWRTHWGRSDNLDGFSFPIWRNRTYDYYSMLTAQASFKLGSRKHKEHYDWLNPIESIYADLDTLNEMKEKLALLLTDSDGDGVPDYYDKEEDSDCDKVYGSGIMVDTDGDGVPDCRDLEPLSPCKDVDENGVVIDSDGDGIPDCLDIEPHSPKGSIVDARGVALTNERLTAAGILDNCCDCNNIMLPSVLFNSGSSNISDNQAALLYLIAEKMKQCPTAKIIATGYTTSKSGEQIAWKRANSIIDHLENNYGIDRSRIEVEYSRSGSGSNVSRRIDLSGGI